MQRHAHRQVCLNTKAKGISDFRSCSPCMRDCHERDCMPDKVGTTFDGVIEGLMAQIRAFLSVDTDTSVMQGERITAPGSPGEKFAKDGGCLRKANFNNYCR